MISPSEYGDAVHSTRFLVAPIKVSNIATVVQLTMVEVSVTHETTNEFDISFYCPEGSTDMTSLARAMGPASINEAMDSWNKKISSSELAAYSTVATATFNTVVDINQQLTGFNTQVVIKIPKGPCVVTAAWIHTLLPQGLMVPTQNETMSGWRLDAIVVGADTSPYGETAARPLSRSLRWDLAAQIGVTFPNLDDAKLVVQHSGALPFHNLWFPTTKRLATDRQYIGVSGSVIRDDTYLRLVSFYDVGFQVVMTICGCVVRDGFNFAKAHIPLTITERMTRCLGPLVWSDGPAGSKTVIGTIGTHKLVVNTEERETYGGVTWVIARRT